MNYSCIFSLLENGLTIEDQEFDILEKRGGGRQKNIVKLKNGHDGSRIYGPREKGLLRERKSEQTYHKSILNAFLFAFFPFAPPLYYLPGLPPSTMVENTVGHKNGAKI